MSNILKRESRLRSPLSSLLSDGEKWMVGFDDGSAAIQYWVMEQLIDADHRASGYALSLQNLGNRHGSSLARPDILLGVRAPVLKVLAGQT